MPRKPKPEAEPFSVVDGKKVDAEFHNHILASAEGNLSADMEAVRRAVEGGESLTDAMNHYAGPEARAFILANQPKP